MREMSPWLGETKRGGVSFIDAFSNIQMGAVK